MADFITDKIYNQETKERFLNSIDLVQYPPRWWERLFEKTYMFENAKQKDLYAFTVLDIREFYKYLDIGTITPLIVYNTNLIKYAQWALNENLIFDGQNHFTEIDNVVLATCLSTDKTLESIFSYEKFTWLLNTLVNDQDKFIFFCLFEGIKGKNYQDIVDMKLSDIDQDNMCVRLNSGRTVYVSKDFINIAIKANEQRVYVSPGNSDQERTLIPGDTILKEKHNSNRININRTVYNTIVRNIAAINGLNEVISAKSIRDSGLIYYLKRRAEKLNISVEELMYAPDLWSDLKDKYQFNLQTRKRWLLQYKNIL